MDLINTADSVVVQLQDATLAIRDVSTLSSFAISPSLTGVHSIGPEPTSLYVSGNYAYVVDASSDDLKVIDISNPSSPFLTGSMGVGSIPSAVHVSSRYAYVVDQDSEELKIIDISNSSSPVLMGSLGIGLLPSALCISGHYAYVINGFTDDLKIIDVSDPASPVLAGSLPIGSIPRAITLEGIHAYIVDGGSQDLKVIDVSDPYAPSLVGSVAIGSIPNAIQVSGRYVYVVDSGSDDLKVIDVSNPSTPVIAGSLGIGSNPTSSFIFGRYVYVVDSGSDDLKVIDVSVPSSPVLVDSLGIGPSPESVSVSGQHAYIVDSGSDDLKVIKLSGEEHTSVVVHSMEVGQLQVRNDIRALGQLQITGGINVGVGGVFSDGDIGISSRLSLSSSNNNSIAIESVGDKGIAIHSAGSDGIFVDNSTDWSVNIQGDKNLTGTPSGHISQIYNRSTGTNADVLALKVGNTANPGSANNFMTFFKGDNNAIGSIEGNGSGGVTFKSGSGDFAEYMPVRSKDEQLKPGDIVGIIDGKITLNTGNADYLMVITDRAIVLGNEPENKEDYAVVGFIGQVPVRVLGVVNAGDWVVASGFHNGTGTAVPQNQITLADKILGPALESSTDHGVKMIHTAIGLDQSSSRDFIIQRLSESLEMQEKVIKDLQRQYRSLLLEWLEYKDQH